MKTTIGIDLGKSAVKVVTKTGSFIIPSVVSYGSINSLINSSITSDDKDFIVSINDSKDSYLAGNIATTNPVNLISMDENKANTPYAVLVASALSKTIPPEHHSEIIVGTALPYTVYEKDKQPLKKILSDIKKFTVNKKHFSVSIHPVVIHEPGAVFMSVALDTNGNIKNKELLKQKIVIVDIGHRTANILLLFEGKELPMSHSTLSGAYFFIYKAISELSKKVGILSLNDQHYVLEKISKNEPIVINNTFFPPEFFEPVKKEFFASIEATVNSILRDFKCDKLIFAGGGAEWLKNLLLISYPNAIIPDNPRFSVATGLFKYANYVNSHMESKMAQARG
jgi:hypothetical protein